MSQTQRLADKIAIVTGGAAGIGRAISLAYAREGATVVVADLRPDAPGDATSSTPTHELITQQGGTSKFFKTDISSNEEVEKLIKDTVAAYGRLDVLVNNAGVVPESIGGAVPFWEIKDHAWQKGIEVNCNGTFYCMRAAAKQMVTQEPFKGGSDRGWIVNISSVRGLKAMALATTYGATKHLILGLTKGAAIDLGPHGVHVNAICPGYVETSILRQYFDFAGESARKSVAEMHPLKGIGQPEDVTGAAVFLASSDAVWISGTNINVDGALMA